MSHTIVTADCLDWLRQQPDDSVDLVFTSPPYEDARTYGIEFKLRGEDWVEWAKPRFRECIRVCRGLVCWVVAGQTRKFRYSGAPFLLMADLIREGYNARDPGVFHRVGIPGSGGPDDLRHDWEPVIRFAKPGKLPWSDNTVCGKPPKWAPGGEMSYRMTNGQRKNAGRRTMNPGGERGRGGEIQHYAPPRFVNPGNVFHCKVGGGLMGSKLAHENEAAFPLKLAEFYVLTFCPPGGTVLDIFAGSGSTAHAARKHGRQSISVDIRESQCELIRGRFHEADGYLNLET